MNNLLIFNPAPHINAMLTSVNNIENEDPFFVGFLCGAFTVLLIIALVHLLFWILDKFSLL